MCCGSCGLEIHPNSQKVRRCQHPMDQSCVDRQFDAWIDKMVARGKAGANAKRAREDANRASSQTKLTAQLRSVACDRAVSQMKDELHEANTACSSGLKATLQQFSVPSAPSDSGREAVQAQARPLKSPQVQHRCKDHSCDSGEISGAGKDDAFVPSGRYLNWVPSIKQCVEAEVQRRGQCRKNRIGSTCSGTCPERRSNNMFNMDVDYCFSCDPKETSVKFLEMNNFLGSCHFMDMMDLAIKGNAVCYQHFEQGIECTLAPFCKLWLDLWLSGNSCKPYSSARTDRNSEVGCDAHVDERLTTEAWAKVLMRLMPLQAVLENVMGFLKIDKKTKMPAISTWIQQCQAHGVWKEYDAVIIIMQGHKYTPHNRKRVYVIVTHKSVGGARANARALQWIRDCDVTLSVVKT